MSSWRVQERQGAVSVEARQAAGQQLFITPDSIAASAKNLSSRLISRIALIEFLAVSTSAYLASAVYHRIAFDVATPVQQYVASSLLLAFLFLLIVLFDDQYNLVGEKWSRRGISRGARAVALAFVFFLSFNFLFKIADDYSRGTFLLQIAVIFPVLMIVRTLLIQRVERAVSAGELQGRRLVVVSLVRNGRSTPVAKRLGQAPDTIARWHDIEFDLSRLRRLNDVPAFELRLASIRDECRKNRADAVVIVFDATFLPQLALITETFYELPGSIQLLPVDLLPYMDRSRISESGRVHVLELSSRRALFDRVLKRGLDLVVATTAIVALSPLLLLVALAIKLDSRGSLLFRQVRHGFNNEPIEVLKFRTMVTANGVRFQQTARNDPRVTRIGYLLRRTNIDELPQLINVLRGDMSLVGPRPHAVEHNEAYAREIKLLNRRHSVRPGITGWAQVNGFRGATDTHEKMQRRIEYDLYYVDNWSFFFDIKILLMTIFSKTAYRNAY